MRKQKNSKPAIKKGFLNSSKNAGTLYPEGSGEGQGGATGGTYTRFMSKCQVVDTSTMSQEETEKAMQDYAGPQGNVKTKQSSTTTITSPSNLATSKPTATAAQPRVALRQSPPAPAVAAAADEARPQPRVATLHRR